ncbi:hypothetical protein L596_005898 [Steinernema carpocapsae]|uniref:SET domain-containing protein n=1 Tax=Steinernema carpocapsae TaxID=34508 RepID=A0A4U8V0K6_STECR|nr:hypothetical protein L596_005898 [Steinernema carpocapsae]
MCRRQVTKRRTARSVYRRPIQKSRTSEETRRRLQAEAPQILQSLALPRKARRAPQNASRHGRGQVSGQARRQVQRRVPKPRTSNRSTTASRRPVSLSATPPRSVPKIVPLFKKLKAAQSDKAIKNKEFFVLRFQTKAPNQKGVGVENGRLTTSLNKDFAFEEVEVWKFGRLLEQKRVEQKPEWSIENLCPQGRSVIDVKLTYVVDHCFTEKYYQQPIYIVPNWEKGKVVLPNFEFSLENTFSASAVELLKNATIRGGCPGLNSPKRCACIKKRTVNCCIKTASGEPAYNNLNQLSAAIIDNPSNFEGGHECSPRCDCEVHICENRIIQRGRQVPLLIMDTAGRGWGIFTLAFIKKGTFVTEYVGDVITDAEARQRGDTEYQWDLTTFYKQQMVIDSKCRGNESRFVNHSCDPNLASIPFRIEFNTGRYYRVGFFAKRDILRGEELTVDYFRQNEKKKNEKRACRQKAEMAKKMAEPPKVVQEAPSRNLRPTSNGKCPQCRCGAEKCRGTFD